MHLAPHQLPLATQALKQNRYKEILPGIRKHFADCTTCRKEVVALIDTIDDIKAIENLMKSIGL